jgi:RHH-type transcriptional regulator, rel operon repressor / antitoxin RelB
VTNIVIYGLTEPGEPWNVRYLGRTRQKDGESADQSINRRLTSHWSEAKDVKVRTHKVYWLRALRDKGQRLGTILLAIGNESDAEDLEDFYITSYMEAGFNLVNYSEGVKHHSALLSVRLDSAVKEQMIQLARATGRSTNSLFNEAVREYLERERWQMADIEQGLRELEAGDIATPEETDAVFERITTLEAIGRARDRLARERW